MYVQTTTDRLLDLQASVLVGVSFKTISLFFVSRDFSYGCRNGGQSDQPLCTVPPRFVILSKIGLGDFGSELPRESDSVSFSRQMVLPQGTVVAGSL